jgi:hypothetical protein
MPGVVAFLEVCENPSLQQIGEVGWDSLMSRCALIGSSALSVQG